MICFSTTNYKRMATAIPTIVNVGFDDIDKVKFSDIGPMMGWMMGPIS